MPPPSRSAGEGDRSGEERLELLLQAQIEQTSQLAGLVERLVMSQASSDGRELVQELMEVMQAASTQSVAESTQALAAAVSQLAPAHLTEEQYDRLADYEALRSELGRTNANGLVGLAWRPPRTLRITGTRLPSAITVLVNGRAYDAEVVSVRGDTTELDVSDLDLRADRRLTVEIRSGDRPVRRAVLVVAYDPSSSLSV